VFGCLEEDLCEIKDKTIWLPGCNSVVLRGEAECDGLNLHTTHFLQTYRVNTAKAIFQYNGSTSGVVNTYGKGKAYLLGTFFLQNSGNDAFLEKILRIEGIDETNEKKVSDGIQFDGNCELMIQYLESECGEVVFAYNKGKQNARFSTEVTDRLTYRGGYGGTIVVGQKIVTVELLSQASGILVFERNDNFGKLDVESESI